MTDSPEDKGPVRKAVLPAAGLGTRFLPATKAMPKEMLPVVDKPAVQYVVEEAVAAGLDDVLLVTGRSKRSIEDHFDRAYELEEALRAKNDTQRLHSVRESSALADVHYVRQGEPRGLGHAVLCASSHVGNEPFAVLLGDQLATEAQAALTTPDATRPAVLEEDNGPSLLNPSHVQRVGGLNETRYVVREGFEPPTSCASCRRSSQLS